MVFGGSNKKKLTASLTKTRRGFFAQVVRLLGAAEALRQKIEIDMTPPERDEYEKEVADLKANMDENEFVSLWADGRSMTMYEAIELTLEDNG